MKRQLIRDIKKNWREIPISSKILLGILLIIPGGFIILGIIGINKLVKHK
jgi:hypothetical protein